MFARGVVWRRLAVLPACCGLLALGWVFVSGGASASPNEVKDRTADKLQRAFRQKVSLDFSNLSLEEAAAKLREATKLEFVADTSAYAAQWTPQEGPAGKVGGISLRVENQPFGTAFKKMLGDQGLGYAILGDTVLLTQQQEAVRRQLDQPLTFDLDQVPLNAALKRLSRDTGTNIVIDSRAAKEAANAVSLNATDLALEDGVRLLANMAGLRTVQLGSVLYVTTKTNAAEFQAEVQSAGRSGTSGQMIRYPPGVYAAPMRGIAGFGAGGRRRGAGGGLP